MVACAACGALTCAANCSTSSGSTTTTSNGSSRSLQAALTQEYTVFAHRKDLQPVEEPVCAVTAVRTSHRQLQPHSHMCQTCQDLGVNNTGRNKGREDQHRAMVIKKLISSLKNQPVLSAWTGTHTHVHPAAHWLSHAQATCTYMSCCSSPACMRLIMQAGWIAVGVAQIPG
jgi:hypothetical protein